MGAGFCSRTGGEMPAGRAIGRHFALQFVPQSRNVIYLAKCHARHQEGAMRFRLITCTAVLLISLAGVAFGAGEAQRADTKAALAALETLARGRGRTVSSGTSSSI